LSARPRGSLTQLWQIGRVGRGRPFVIRYVSVMPARLDTPVTVGTTSPRIRFGEEPKADGAWMGRRLILLDDEPAFELSFWCGTCQFLFERLEGANQTVSIESLQSALGDDDQVDVETVIALFGQILELGRYVPMLSDVVPRLTRPGDDRDYFTNEQVATWGLDGFWGLPLSPRVPYYRTLSTPVDDAAHLYEFVVPMVPPSWNDSQQVAAYRADIDEGRTPTAVAVSTLDVCAPAVTRPGTDYYAHWGLTHFLLDGHHKVAAGAQAGRPVRLLTLVSLDASLATEEQVLRLPNVRQRPMSARHTVRRD
jgi:hypothetical protein